MSRTKISRLTVLSLAGLLAACGGGGGGGGNSNAIPSTITLTSEQDVIREVTNVATLFVPDSVPAASSAPSGGARYSSMGVRGWAFSGGSTARVRAKSMRPQAETIPCPAGGSYTSEEFLEVSRNLPLFGVSPTMDYWVDMDSSCRYTEGTYTQTTSGPNEYGDNYFYTSTTPENPAYDYFVYGSGATPYTYVGQDSTFNERYTQKFLGRSEYRDNGTSMESRDVLTLDIVYSPGTSGNDGISIDGVAGKSGDPLIFSDNYGAGTFTLDGPLGYKSNSCAGGTVAFDTTTPMTVGSDQFGTFVSGGTLVIASGNNSVTLVFQADGGIQYQFAGGNSGEITRSELLASTDDCLFVP